MASRSASTTTLVTSAKRCTASVTPARTGCHAFSTTPQSQRTSSNRRRFYNWLETRGHRLQSSEEWDTRTKPTLGYFEGQPFPLNPYFRSEAVLGSEIRKHIYEEVRHKKTPMKVVSIKYGVDVRRIAAVLRMKDIEREWNKEGKKLATPYATAIEKLVPQHQFDPEKPVHFEPINELHVHKLTQQQLFVPVAESREFTREDAAKAFHRSMLPPDERAPNKELIDLERARLAGEDGRKAWSELVEKVKKEEERHNKKVHQERVAEEARTERVNTDRFEFRIKNVNIELAGRDGRGRGGTGMRYGVPFNDRKKGAVKIPTSMP